MNWDNDGDKDLEKVRPLRSREVATCKYQEVLPTWRACVRR
jgi:hypothetical protein